MDKCVYADLELPCENCIQRRLPSICVKRWGPRKDFDSSRRVQTPGDEVIPPEEVLLLQWIYIGEEHKEQWEVQESRYLRDTQWELFNLAKQLIPVYKPSIQCHSLRYSLLTYIGIMTSGGKFESREDINSHRARQAILRSSQTSFTEGDLFASVLLGLTVPSNPNHTFTELEIHLRGVLAIMTHIHETPGVYNLVRFWPLARDLLFSFRLRGITDTEFGYFYLQSRNILGPPSLDQRCTYLGENYYLGISVSLHYHDKLLSRVTRVSFKGTSDEAAHFVSTAISDVKNDLMSIKESMARYRISPEWIPNWNFYQSLSPTNSLKLPICNILVAMLNAPNMLEGLESPEVRNEAIGLLMRISLVKRYRAKVKVDKELYTSNVCRRGIGLATVSFPPQFLSQLLIENGF